MQVNLGISNGISIKDDKIKDAKTNAQSSEDTAANHDLSALEQANAQVISQLEISLSTQNAKENPQIVIFKAAINKINDLLADEMGPNATQAAISNPSDFTPEATANRIVSLSTGFFPLFKEQHPEMAEAEALGTFMKLIRSGVDQGFNEAKDILQGLQVWQDSVSDNANKTYDLIQKGFDDFEAQYKQPSSDR